MNIETNFKQAHKKPSNQPNQKLIK